MWPLGQLPLLHDGWGGVGGHKTAAGVANKLAYLCLYTAGRLEN